MKIEVFYLNGRVKVYDTDTFCTSEPFLHDNIEGNSNIDKSTNNIVVFSSVDIRIDNLFDEKNTENKQKGIYALVNYYETNCNANEIRINKFTQQDFKNKNEYIVTNKRCGRCVPLISSGELYLISHIDIDGKVCVKNVNGELINVSQIEAMYATEILDENNTAYLDKIIRLYNQKINSSEYKDLTKSEIVKKLGVTEKILNIAVENRKSTERFLKSKDNEYNSEKEIK